MILSFSIFLIIFMIHIGEKEQFKPYDHLCSISFSMVYSFFKDQQIYYLNSFCIIFFSFLGQLPEDFYSFLVNFSYIKYIKDPLPWLFITIIFIFQAFKIIYFAI